MVAERRVDYAYGRQIGGAESHFSECRIFNKYFPPVSRIPQIEELNELWWSEISAHSRRDQLSLDYVLWRLGIRPAHFPATVYTSPELFVWQKHRRYGPQRWLLESWARRLRNRLAKAGAG